MTIEPSQVSCVIPYAGAEKYLQEVVRSALAQKFREVIIVNDGCPPSQLESVEKLPGIRIIHQPRSVGCPNARNIGLKACATPYVVLLDHDDLLAAGYLEAMLEWVTENGLRCGAATLRYIGESSRRVGALVSRDENFCLPSGFFSELALIKEVGCFPDSYGDDTLFFHAIRKVARLATCPGAGVLYRIHPQAESSRNIKAWWAFSALVSLYYSGARSLAEINTMARDYAASGTIPPGLESRLSNAGAAEARLLGRSAYACWLNRDFPGLARYGFKLLQHIPELTRLIRKKWMARRRPAV